MKDVFYKIDHSTMFWSKKYRYYYDNDDTGMVREKNYLRDKEQSKIYKVTDNKLIYLRKEKIQSIKNRFYIWRK